MFTFETKTKNTIVFAILFLFFAELIRTAWVSDDAAITLRTVLNFIHGYGPRFNIDERVQAYTHPLWFLLLSLISLITNRVFISAYVLSIGVSLFSLWFFLSRVSTNFALGIIAACALILSKAFVDFATSGLENPLSHLLLLFIVVFAIRASERQDQRSLSAYFFNCSLLYLSRPDLILLVSPLTLFVLLRNKATPKIVLKSIVIGAIPAVLWTVFSLYYYGFPFPNTAYAKLGTGIALRERIFQGFKYYMDSLDRDPLTIVFIALSIYLTARSSALAKSLVLGISLYALYVLSIGGDFMSGRFLTAPLLISCVLVAQTELSRAQVAILAICVTLFGTIGINGTLLSSSSFTNMSINANGIADERGAYFNRMGLVNAKESFITGKIDWKIKQKSTGILCGGLGIHSITEGPGMHDIDLCALADPLLARLPAKKEADWRIGHFFRQLPTNYLASIQTGQNLLADPATHQYYESIRTITRGDLNDPSRLWEIVRFNMGGITTPDFSVYRKGIIRPYSEMQRVSAIQLGHIMEGGTWDAPGATIFGKLIDIALEQEMQISKIDISVDHNDSYRIEALVGGKFIPIQDISPVDTVGLARHIYKLDTPSPKTNLIRLSVLSGDGMYSIGHFIVH